MHHCCPACANRDIKPENFVFSSMGEDAVLKLTDFGLAAPIKSHEDVLAKVPAVLTCGTLHVMV